MQLLRTLFYVVVSFHFDSILVGLTFADEPILPPGDTSPLLRLETNGPRSYVSGLAFSPDGTHLYSTGWDKAVQVWNLQQNQKYEYSSGATLRVPTGAGAFGELNGLALSSNGMWLATAGQGLPREVPGERTIGWVVPVGDMSRTSQLDNGMIYVFNTVTRETILLRGHRGPVQALAFVKNSQSDVPELVSVAEERINDSGALVCRVKLWDVKKAIEIASLSSVPNQDGKKWDPLPQLNGFRPGVSAWSTGPKSNQSRVALAWGDDQLRVWDTQTGQVASVKTNPNLLTVVPLNGRGDQLITGAHKEIGTWSVPNGENGQLGAITRQNFQRSQIDSVNGQDQNLASAAALVPSNKGLPELVAFVVTRYLPNNRGEYRLVIATTRAPMKTVREINLPWSGEIRQPSIAISPDGTRVALAGNERHEIEIYRLDDLLAGRNVPAQILGSVGLALRDATFVRSGESWGLQLAEARRDMTGRLPEKSLVFDINQRQIEQASDKWQPAIASVEGWETEVNAGTVIVRIPGKNALSIKLIDEHIATAWASCPVSPLCPVPLIAVASQVRGQPLLQLFNGDTGDPLRWCFGHTERIRSLSFSEDGRMLVSVGEDRTVSVWTTTDLAQRTINQHGRITGLTVHHQGEKIVVTAAPIGSEFERGDEVVSALLGRDVVELNSAKRFYRFAWGQRPGSTIEYTIRRRGELKSVKSLVSQAIDVAKPLFTLFIAPGERDGDWEWIGWNPIGNFDLHGDRIDRLLGWHFNTDDPQHPAKFAPIGEYRDAFYRRDLLQTLIEFQKLPPVVIIEQEPKVSVWLRQQDGTPVPTDYENVPQLDSALVELVAEVSGPTDRQIQSLVASIDDAAPIPMKKSAAGQEWTVDLSDVAWTRGEHRLRVLLKTAHREVESDERVNFYPARPTVGWDVDPKWKREFPSAEVAVNATVTPKSEPIQVQLLLQRPGKDEAVVLRTWETREPLTITENVAVEPGENRLEILAWNKSVPRESRDSESARVSTFVRRATPLMAPRLVVDSLSARPDIGEPKLLIAEGDAYRSSWPKVLIRGDITAQSKISRASLSLGGKRNDLTGFRPGDTREFSFEETVTLEPGRQSVVIQSAVGEEQDEKRLVIVYEPPSPQIASMTAIVQPLRELPKTAIADPLVFYHRYHEPEATISAKLEGQLSQAYRVAIKVNDLLIPEDKLKIDRSIDGQHIVTATIPLGGGKNAVAMRVDNEWTRQPSSRMLELEFRRPPEILEIQAETKLIGKPFDLACRIRSAIPIRSAKIVIDNSEEIAGSFSAVEGESDEYLLRTEKIGLSAGEHIFKVSALNDEGTTIEPAVHTVSIEKPAAKPPILAIVGPAGDTDVPVSSKRLEIQYTVESEVPATIQIKNRGSRLDELSISSNDVPIDGKKGVVLLDLLEGVNEIELTAHSSGGFSEKRFLKISYVPAASTVEIVSIDEQQPQLKNDGAGMFERSATKARVKLRGRIKTNAPLSTGKTLKARIWVNNFKLPTVDVTIDQNESTTGAFATEITLSRAKQNEIKVEVYGDEGKVASALGCTNTLKIDCDKPERRQDLYLVLLGTGDSDGLRDHAKTALQAKSKTKAEASQEMWESDAFSQIHVFDALNVHPVTAQHRLLNLVRTMNGNLKNAAKSGPQAIVMVYFQGQISLTNDDFTFVTSDTQVPTEKSITGKRLEANLSNTYGAHLIFLDLTQNTKNLTASDIWPKAPQLGIVVSNWLGNGQQPAETRLITALEQTLPQIRVVRDLADKIDQRYQLARKKFPEQIETVDRLQGLRDLQIGVLD